MLLVLSYLVSSIFLVALVYVYTLAYAVTYVSEGALRFIASMYNCVKFTER